jgi:hypothetical protein
MFCVHVVGTVDDLRVRVLFNVLTHFLSSVVITVRELFVFQKDKARGHDGSVS